jgi:hypothetical protein
VRKRNAGVGLAATAFDLQPAVAAIEALCDLGGGLRRARRNVHLFKPEQTQAGSVRPFTGDPAAKRAESIAM